ncbi:MAG: hypothetical protein WA957_15030, partial [Alteraurantiacibacter sp.]
MTKGIILTAFTAALSTFSLSDASAQMFNISDEDWSNEEVSLPESLDESLIFGFARWDAVGRYSRSSNIYTQSRSIARLKIRHSNGRMGLCTAFLVAPSIAMTNNHCLPGDGQGIEARLEFGALLEFGNDPYR